MTNMSVTKITRTVRLILENQGHVLLLAQTTKNGGKYALAGGKIDFPETAIEALIRECKEEIDIDLNPDNLTLVHTMQQQKEGGVQIVFFFHAHNYEGYCASQETTKFKATAWFPLHQCPENLSRQTKLGLDFFQKKIPFSEFQF
jgi:8-oxo-dGTP diphosphatase